MTATPPIADNSITIGVDVGGTFTDVVCRGPGDRMRVVKIPTSRADPSLAVITSLEHARDAWNVPPEKVTRFVHGTTTATNAVLEQKGASGRVVRAGAAQTLLADEELARVYLGQGLSHG